MAIESKRETGEAEWKEQREDVGKHGQDEGKREASKL